MSVDFNDKDVVRSILPDRYSRKLDDTIMKMISGMGRSIDMDEEVMQDMFVQGIPALSRAGTSRTTVTKYVDALRFVASKLKTESNVEAYKLTFPEKSMEAIKLGKEDNLNAMASFMNNSPLVVAIEADMMVDMHIQYAGMRHKAIQHQFNLMNGHASPSKVAMFERDENGKVVKDEYGRPIKMRYPDGSIVYDLVYPSVSPTVQQLASKTVLELTNIPIDTTIKIEHSINDETLNATRDTNNRLHELAKAMHDNLANGGDLNKIQVIGHIVDPSLEEKKKNNGDDLDDILDIDVEG